MQEEPPQQAAHLGHGRRDEFGGQPGGAPHFRPGRPPPHDGEEGLRQERQGDVPVPAIPAAHLVVGQAGLAFGDLEAFLDRPAGPGHAHERSIRRGEDDVIRQVGWVVEAPTREQPLLSPGHRPAGEAHARPGVGAPSPADHSPTAACSTIAVIPASSPHGA